jgi:light-regulated signal transduction histidine kinase (bacteriophytochrome)
MKSGNRIIGIYVAVGIAWILFSDTMVTYLFRDPDTIRLISIAKGWFFIVITAVLLHVLIRQHTLEILASERMVIKLNEDLSKRNSELEVSNRELESFIYSLSHDLRAPLRAVSSFATFLKKDYSGMLDDQGNDYLSRIDHGTARMNVLIEDLLSLSKISKHKLKRSVIDLSDIASSIISDFRNSYPSRNVQIHIADGLKVSADPVLMRIALSNILENAWKFTSKQENALITFGSEERRDETVFYIRDNGAGFDLNHGKKMFEPFHRLHSTDEFEGIGAGLAVVERIISRHGGKVWAEGDVGKGAAFFFTLN